MKNKNKLNTINWLIFTFIAVIGVITITNTLINLNNFEVTTEPLEAYQSRAAFHWGTINTVLLVVLLLITTFLAIGWKRLFPFNVPIALIVAGFYYFLFFLTFTLGWVRIQGIIGLLIAILTGVMLIIIYVVIILMNRKRDKG